MKRIYREATVKVSIKHGIVTIQLGAHSYALTREEAIALRDALTLTTD